MSLFAKLILFLTLPLYALDQATKLWTVRNFTEPMLGFSSETSLTIVENFFYWRRDHNQGVAFGLGNGTAWAPVVFLLVPVIAMVVLRVLWKKGVFATVPSKVALALLLCGIFGNLTDRLVQGFLLQRLTEESWWVRFSAGYVVDFLSIKLPLYDKLVPRSGGWWPTFNVADSCVCVSAFILFLSSFWDEKNKKKAKAPFTEENA